MLGIIECGECGNEISKTKAFRVNDKVLGKTVMCQFCSTIRAQGGWITGKVRRYDKEELDE